MPDGKRALQPQDLPPPPPSPVWVLPLRVTAYSRVIAFLRGLVPLLVLTTTVVVVLDEEFVAPPTLSGRIGLVVVGFHAGAGLLCLGVLMLRTAFARHPRLQVDPAGITIHHSGILRWPLHVPKSEIKLAAVDPTVPQRRLHLGPRDHRRFPLDSPPGYEGPALPGWLYSREAGSPFPLVSHLGDPPNLLLMFRRSLPVVGARRTLKILAAKGPIHVVRPRQETHGLMLRIASPEQGRRAFHQHELLGQIAGRDILVASPGQAQYERARTYNTRANLLVGAVIAVNTLPIMLVLGVGPADESAMMQAWRLLLKISTSFL